MSVTKLERAGTFLAHIQESGVILTKEKKDGDGNTINSGGKPMWTATFQTAKFYVQSATDLQFYKDNGVITDLTPQWVDYPKEETTALMLLFNDDKNFCQDTAMTNYKQIVSATKWDGQDFSTLDTVPIGDLVLIRVEENRWNDNINYRVEWIDSKDASPTRKLNKLDVDKLKTLPKIKMGGVKKSPAPASAATAAPPNPTTSAPPTTAPAPAPETAAPATLTVPTDLDKAKAWDFVNANKGDNESEVIVEAWTDAVGEVSENNGNISDDEFNVTMWEKVVKIIVRDCALSA